MIGHDHRMHLSQDTSCRYRRLSSNTFRDLPGLLGSLPKLASVIAFLIIMQTNVAFGQFKTATNVGQVNGTPVGSPNQTVRLEAGLSASGGSWGYSQCISGPVRLYYANGSKWTYVRESMATGCYGSLNTYGKATFSFKIPSNIKRGTFLRVKYEYPGSWLHYSSVGYGSIRVQ